MEVILIYTAKMLILLSYSPSQKQSSLCSAYSASHAMLPQMCARVCTGHGWEEKPRVSLILGRKESLLILGTKPE